jgi:hypothetical protein
MRKLFFSSIIILSTLLMGGCSEESTPPTPTPEPEPPTPTPAKIVINEAYSRGEKGNPYGELDWVELYNAGDLEGDVSGFILYDKEDKVERITLAPNTIIPPKGFLLIEVDIDGGFGLSSGGDKVTLEDTAGNVVDHIEFGILSLVQAYARNQDGSTNFVAQQPTRGKSNNTEPPITKVDYSNIVINEVDGNGKFVELYNKSSSSVSLAGLMLIKNEKDIWWYAEENATVSAKGYYTIAQSGGATGASEYSGISGISAKKTLKFELVSAYETWDSFTRLKADNAIDVDCTPDYGKANDGGIYSFSRCPDGADNFGLAVPSCNTANPGTSAGIIETK